MCLLLEKRYSFQMKGMNVLFRNNYQFFDYHEILTEE